MDSPLAALPLIWLKNIQRAKTRRQKEFDEDAEKALAFYDGEHDWVFDKSTTGSSTSTSNSSGGKSTSENFAAPDFKMTVNRTFEFVSIMGPMIYNQNPTVRIEPRTYPEVPPEVWGNPMMAQMMGQQIQMDKSRDRVVCQLLSNYLNYIPNETAMLGHARKACDEALIKGMGVLFTEVYTPTGSKTKMVRATHVNTKNVYLDPDASCYEDLQWIAIECCEPVAQVEKDYGLPAGTLDKGNQESSFMSAAVDTELVSKHSRNKSETYDTMTYWKIYSKIGLGSMDGWLQGEAASSLSAMVGEYVFLAVAPNVPYPINLHPDSLAELETDQMAPNYQMSLEFLREKLSWQVPYYLDDAWPIEFLSFYGSPGKLWPMSPLKPAFGEQYAIDWIYSMLISKLRVACRSILAVSADAPPDVMDILNNGADYQVVQLGKAGALDKYIQQFSFDPFNKEIWSVLQGIEQNFSQRTGLLPMLYGAQGDRQVRTAAEGNALSNNLNIRPQHMKDCVENWFTRIFRRMALATRYHIKGVDIAPMMGPEYATLWDGLIANVDPDTMVREYQYRIEAGSTRKPNPDAQTANMEQAANTLLPQLFQAMAMNPENAKPLNHLLESIMKSRGQEWLYPILPPMPPPMPMGPGGLMPPGGPAPQEQPQQAPPQGQPEQQPQGDIPPETLAQMLLQIQQGGPVPPELQAVQQASQESGIAPQQIAATIVKQQTEPNSQLPKLTAMEKKLSEIEQAVVMAIKELTNIKSKPPTKKKMRVTRDENQRINGLEEE